MLKTCVNTKIDKVKNTKVNGDEILKAKETKTPGIKNQVNRGKNMSNNNFGNRSSNQYVLVLV